MDTIRQFTKNTLKEHLVILNKYHKTQRAAARSIGVTPSQYNRWCKGKAWPMPISTMNIRAEVKRIHAEKRVYFKSPNPRLVE